MSVHLFCGQYLGDEHETLHHSTNGLPLRRIYDTGMIYALGSQSKKIFILRDDDAALTPS